MQETLKKAEQVKLRVKVESPEVQEVLIKLGYHKVGTEPESYAFFKHIKRGQNKEAWSIGIHVADGSIEMIGTDLFEDTNVEQRYQVELYLLIAAGVVTFE